MSQKRIRSRPVAAAISFTEVSPKHQRHRKCRQQLHDTTQPSDEEPTGSSGLPLSPVSDPDIFSGIDLAFPVTTFSSQQAQSYLIHQERLPEAWSQIRKHLRTAIIESSVPSLGTSCSTCEQAAVVISQQCSPRGVYWGVYRVTSFDMQHIPPSAAVPGIFHDTTLFSACLFYG